MIDAEALTIPEACAASRIGRTKIYQAIKEGRLVARKLGKKTLILPSDLRDYLSSLPSDGARSRDVVIVDTTHRPFFRTFTGLADARSATDANTVSNHL